MKARDDACPPHLFVEERRLPNLVLPHHVQIHPFLRHHELPPTARSPAIHPIQELLHQPLVIPHKPLHDAPFTAQLQLIPEIRQFALRQRLRGRERFGRGVVRRGDGEHGRDERRVPLRDAVDGRAAPVVAAEDELRDVQLAGDGGDGVGVGQEAVLSQVGRVALMLRLDVRMVDGEGASRLLWRTVLP